MCAKKYQTKEQHDRSAHNLKNKIHNISNFWQVWTSKPDCQAQITTSGTKHFLKDKGNFFLIWRVFQRSDKLLTALKIEKNQLHDNNGVKFNIMRESLKSAFNFILF